MERAVEEKEQSLKHIVTEKPFVVQRIAFIFEVKINLSRVTIFCLRSKSQNLVSISSKSRSVNVIF